MRTTLDLDDDILAVARSLARERGVSIGTAMSDLARRGWQRRSVETRRAVPGFTVDHDSQPITPEMVRSASEDW